MHLEFGTVPLNIIHKGRRANYQQHVLKKEKTELVRKVYSAQEDNIKSGDFCQFVSSDLKDLNVHMSEQQIASTGTQQILHQM